MANAVTAVVVFIAILAAISYFFVKMGKLSFWKLAAKLPDEAVE